MDGAQIPLDAADRQAPFFPQRGDAAEHVDAQALAHPVPRRPVVLGALGAADTWAGPGDEDMLGDLHRTSTWQLDESRVMRWTCCCASGGQGVVHIGPVLHPCCSDAPMGRCHPSGRRGLTKLNGAAAALGPGGPSAWSSTTGAEAGHSGRAARFRLAFQFGNPPLQPLNHPLLFQNGDLQLGNAGDEDIAVDGGQVTLSIHSLYMT